MAHPVVIADYDPQWPILFEEEKGRMLGVNGERVVAIEHIGSTAVPGLGAKPVIDIMVGVRRLADAEDLRWIRETEQLIRTNRAIMFLTAHLYAGNPPGGRIFCGPENQALNHPPSTNIVWPVI